MYGIILESIKTTIEETYSKEIWEVIAVDLNLSIEEIDFYKIYPDDLVSNIINCKFICY